MATRQDIIVAAVDGSEASETAVRWAANTATKRGTPLRLAASINAPQVFYSAALMPADELLYDTRGETEEALARARLIALEVSPELTVEDFIAEGNPIDMLLNMSGEVTMIAMGSRGLGGLTSMIMGSVSAAVVSHAACPVVIVRHDTNVTEANKYGPVVVGVDGSEVSQKATEYAFAEADARGAELIAVHTWLDTNVRTTAVGFGTAQLTWEQAKQDQDQMLADLLRPLQDTYPGVKVTRTVARDRPVRALTDQAEDAQLLVVGSHGRGGFRGMLLGSTSRALLDTAPCPMMVVRPEHRAV